MRWGTRTPTPDSMILPPWSRAKLGWRTTQMFFQAECYTLTQKGPVERDHEEGPPPSLKQTPPEEFWKPPQNPPPPLTIQQQARRSSVPSMNAEAMCFLNARHLTRSLSRKSWSGLKTLSPIIFYVLEERFNHLTIIIIEKRWDFPSLW